MLPCWFLLSDFVTQDGGPWKLWCKSMFIFSSFNNCLWFTQGAKCGCFVEKKFSHNAN
jgi:hypothetical protein